MSFLPIILLALAGLFAWLSTRGTAATSTSSGTEAAKAEGFDIAKIGGDTVFPDQAKEFEQLRAMAQDVIGWGGGRVSVKSPDYLLEFDAANNGQTFPVPVVTTDVVARDGRYVPGDAILVGYGGQRTLKSQQSVFTDVNSRMTYGYWDTYATGTPGEANFQVFRPEATARRPLGYTLLGGERLPACLKTLAIEVSGGFMYELYYDESKDPGGVWAAKGAGQFWKPIDQYPPPE